MSGLYLISDFVAGQTLLRCPFCGEVPTHVRETQGTKWGNVTCCCEGPEVRTGYETPDKWITFAIEAWNERKP